MADLPRDPGNGTCPSFRRIWPQALLLAAAVSGASTAAIAAASQPSARAATAATPHALAAPTISHGRFADIPIAQPRGPVQRFIVWLVDGVPARQRAARVAALMADGAMVATVDMRRLERALQADGHACLFNVGDVENFSRYVQAYYRLPTYRAAILIGDGEGAALAYALNAQAQPGVLAGAVSLDFCPVMGLANAVCPSGALKIAPGPRGGAILSPTVPALPWAVSTVPTAHHCARLAGHFVGAVAGAQVLAPDASGALLPAIRSTVIAMGAQRDVSVPPPPKNLAGLPIVEVPGKPGGNDDTFAVFVSGDGGWAGLDKDVAASLAAAGVPVAGIDSLRYFWTARTPQVFGADLDRVIRYYAAHWKRRHVLLIGFSQGADVLPGGVTHLPLTTRRTVTLTTLMSAGQYADFEFHLSNWLGTSAKGRPLAPDIKLMDPARTLCLYGLADKDALCPTLPPGAAKVVGLPGDHHFAGDNRRLAREILSAARIAP